ncbi:MAG: fructose-bisphosphate aldolase, class [Pseudonocardiales bacterium]|nr:fructose-bisphosphate aldolase, class [Pseudonocardiales bacterium]
MEDLHRRARRLFAFRRGILGLDSAPACLTARFRVASIRPSVRATDGYLAMLLGTADLADATSGVVLHPETFERLACRAQRTAALLGDAGILVGVRADTGSEPLSSDGRELVTSGVDGLAARLGRMAELGATFAVWSTVTSTDPDALRMVTANSQAAARFGYLCQDLGLVPVIRVGTRMTGGAAAPLTGGLFCPREASVAAALLSVCGHLEDFGVDLGAVVISTDPGTASPHPLAGSPLAALPDGLGGVALTGGWHSPAAAADAVARVCLAEPPWPVTFYLGRQLTQPALAAWGGRAASVPAGQRVLRAGLSTASAALCAAEVVDSPALAARTTP